ncbi:hypothetical protein BDR26DRAFT_81834 [Obelidium mucronatum]|nr:hypothetical protein BDR26DRAFT_81834 [Obelidium mucronatum]
MMPQQHQYQHQQHQHQYQQSQRQNQQTGQFPFAQLPFFQHQNQFVLQPPPALSLSQTTPFGIHSLGPQFEPLARLSLLPLHMQPEALAQTPKELKVKTLSLISALLASFYSPLELSTLGVSPEVVALASQFEPKKLSKAEKKRVKSLRDQRRKLTAYKAGSSGVPFGQIRKPVVNPTRPAGPKQRFPPEHFHPIPGQAPVPVFHQTSGLPHSLLIRPNAIQTPQVPPKANPTSQSQSSELSTAEKLEKLKAVLRASKLSVVTPINNKPVESKSSRKGI